MLNPPKRPSLRMHDNIRVPHPLGEGVQTCYYHIQTPTYWCFFIASEPLNALPVRTCHLLIRYATSLDPISGQTEGRAWSDFSLCWHWRYSWMDFLKAFIFRKKVKKKNQQGPRSATVTCLTTDACLTADPGVASSIPAPSHTFVVIDIIKWFLRSFSSLPLNHSRRFVVSYKRKYVHEVLVNRLFKLAKEKVWLGELTVPPRP